MNLLSLRKNGFLLIIVLLLLTLFQYKVNAADIDTSDYSAFEESSSSETESYSPPATKSKRHFQKRDPLELSDSTFNSSENNTFQALLFRVTTIVLILLMIFGVIKILANRRGVIQGNGFLEGLKDKFSGNLSAFTSQLGGLTLKQSLILAPGQNVYLVEVDGKRLLLGATQYGGVQFLADLTTKNESVGNKSSILSGKQIEEFQSQKKYNFLNHFPGNQSQKEAMQQTPFFESNSQASKEEPSQIDMSEQKVAREFSVHSNRNSFRKKVNFKESLLRNSVAGENALASLK
jgi:flagellar biogenesis protein FliO